MTKHTKQSVCDLIRPYPGKWVALNFAQTKVVGVASSVKAVLRKAHKMGEAVPHLIKVPDGSVAAFIY